MKRFKVDEVFFTSDTHFSHKNLLKYTSRPFATIEEMNEGLIANWNAVVKPTDTVIHCGDFAFAGKTFIRETVAKLNGSIILIKGNHDEKPPEDAFEAIHQYFECRIGEQDIACLHYPMESWNRMHYGTWHLHGHCHGSLKINENLKRMDVGIDCHPECRPFSFMEISMVMENRRFVAVDHHE